MFQTAVVPAESRFEFAIVFRNIEEDVRRRSFGVEELAVARKATSEHHQPEAKDRKAEASS